MRKYLLATGVGLIIAVSLLFYFCLNNRSVLSCESKYDVTQQINEDTFRAEGLLSAEFSPDGLFINFEGLITSNDEKYIVSRSISLSLKKYKNSRTLFHAPEIRIIRHNNDNTPESIAQKIIFSDQNNGRIIYINHINDDTILFGNPAFPQYGCKRK
ncbi:FidL-like protein [uncultured Klebsiella sp.]|uniref:FidL-like protein n=1 Tax=uncultured Klebsiella sp. TaxID=284011 RepID=UPI0028038480|nr:FidL-like protein [uncultured Klebsiella sp.]